MVLCRRRPLAALEVLVLLAFTALAPAADAAQSVSHEHQQQIAGIWLLPQHLLC